MGPGFTRNLRKPLPALRSRQQHGLDHADDRVNRARATRGARRGFKFGQFETDEFARADEFAQQRAQRRRAQPALDPVFGGQIERVDHIRVDVKLDRRASTASITRSVSIIPCFAAMTLH